LNDLLRLKLRLTKDIKCPILLVILLGFTISSSAQSFISEVEIFAGPSLLSIRDNNQYKKYGEIKIGYSFGAGLVHKISKVGLSIP